MAHVFDMSVDPSRSGTQRGSPLLAQTVRIEAKHEMAELTLNAKNSWIIRLDTHQKHRRVWDAADLAVRSLKLNVM